MSASTLMKQAKKDLVNLIIKREEELASMDKKYSKLYTDYNELTKKYQTAQAKIEDLTKTNKRLDKELNANAQLDAELQEIKKKYNSIKDKYEQVCNESVASKNKIKELTDTIEQNQESLKRKDGRINELTNDLKGTKVERDDYQQTAESYEKEIDDMTTSLAIMTKKAKDYKLCSFALSIVTIVLLLFMCFCL